MKSKEFKTSKGEFVIVDSVGRDNYYEVIRYYIENNIQIKYINLLKYITEDQAKEIFGDMEFHNFGDYLHTNKLKLEALIKSLGIHLYDSYSEECGNFFCENGKIDIGYGEFTRCCLCEERDDNTFYNPYIFKKI